MHLNMSGKKLFLIGFIVILLIGIPLTIFLVQRQQETRSRAEKSTNITFTPDSSPTTPIQASVGDSIPLDITVNPGTNLVSFVKLEIQYDPDKLATDSAKAFQANTVVFPSVLEGPVYTSGKISVTLSVGSDPTKAIQSTVTAATVTFKALANTPEGTPTLVSYGATTQVLSIGSNDQASENVLSAATPANIIIGSAAVGPTEPIPTTPPVDTTPTDSPIQPTQAPTDFPTQAPTQPPIDGGVTSQPPTCNNLAVDRDPTGDAPLAITFTADGTDSDGTISKVTFNFGDGQVSDVTAEGGVGTASVSAQLAHTYTTAGTFQASAILTDDSNGVSSSDTCTQTVTVTGGATGGGDPVPTLEPTGTTEVALGIGAFLLALVVGGGFLFFFL